MKTREEIFKALLEDSSISEIMLELSGSYREFKDLRYAFPVYFRLCAAISNAVNALDLPGEHCPPDAKGISTCIPFVAMGMPGVSQGFVEHWADNYLESQGVDPLFYTDKAREANDQGIEGKPSYLHGLLVCATVSDSIMQMMGAQLLIATAENLSEGLEASGSAGSLH